MGIGRCCGRTPWIATATVCAGLFLGSSPAAAAEPIVPAYGVVIGWDAATEDGGDTSWEAHLDPYAGPTGTVWSLTGPWHLMFTPDDTTKGIGASFQFDATDSATLAPPNPEILPLNPTDFSASLEMWFKPVSLAGGKQLLLSIGGASDGVSFLLDDDVFRFSVKDTDVRDNTGGNGQEDLLTSIKTSLTGVATGQFVHVVGVVEVRGRGEYSALYIDGQLATPISDGGTGLFVDETVIAGPGSNAAQVPGTQGQNPVTFRTEVEPGSTSVGIADWAGSGAARLVRNGSDIGAHALGAGGLLDLSAFKNKTYQGQIASFNIYPRALTTGQVAVLYNQMAEAVTFQQLELATNGLLFDYNAGVAYGGSTWENINRVEPKDSLPSDTADWEFSRTDTSNLVVGVSGYPGIAAAFQFSPAGNDDGRVTGVTVNGDSRDTLPEFVNNLDNGDATFEIWFKPSDHSGKEILLETGGSGDGMSIRLNDSMLEFAVSNNNNTNLTTVQRRGLAVANLASFPTNEFIQAVGVVDMASDEVRLYVNGFARDTHSGWLGIDWDGGDAAGLGHLGGSTLGGGEDSGYGDFNGQIARLRVYDGALSDTQILENWREITGWIGGSLFIVH